MEVNHQFQGNTRNLVETQQGESQSHRIEKGQVHLKNIVLEIGQVHMINIVLEKTDMTESVIKDLIREEIRTDLEVDQTLLPSKGKNIGQGRHLIKSIKVGQDHQM